MNIDQLNGSPQTESPANDARREAAVEVLLSLSSLFAATKQLFVAGRTSNADGELPGVDTIVRSLLLAGAGKGYGPTYEGAIRSFVHAFEAMQLWERRQTEELVDRQLCEDAKTRWGRELRDRAATLKLLGVKIEPVRIGVEVDPEKHRVNLLERRETSDKSLLHRIAEVKSPAFSWTEEGQRRFREAEVVVYSKVTRSRSAGRGRPR